ncbi:MAG: HAMP domain-containing sensor histidine kinase [Gemmatimonadota bacterium]
MRLRADRRRTLILLAAVLLPSAALLAISVRLVRQERELAERRFVQSRRGAAERLGQDLTVRLERIRTGALLALQDGRIIAGDSGLVLAAVVRKDHFALPWESADAPRTAAVGDLLARGNGAEFGGEAVRADSLYRQVEVLAADSATQLLARLYRARTLARNGRSTEARTLYTRLLEVPLHIRDEEDMPLALYAAQWLRAQGETRTRIADVLSPQLAHAALGPVALYALREQVHVADSLRVEQRIAEAEQLLALRRDYAAVRSNALARAGAEWLPYGPQLWLIAPDTHHIVVVRSATLLNQSSARLTRDAAYNSEPLGASLAGLFAVIPDAQVAGEDVAVNGWLLPIAILLTLIITSLAAYLGWRDLRRETRAGALRTQFVSSVSHELKTPLTAIRMYAELLRMGIEHAPEKRADYLNTIVSESERLTRLINNVLDFSRIERDEKSYQLAPCSLEQLAHEIERTMSYPLAQSGLELHVAVQPDLPPVQADADALAQATLNLLSNAVKFRRPEPTATRIDFIVERQNGCVFLRVKDRGRGIAAGAQPHIFEKFYRSPEVEADGIPGTGLGLALVAHIARGHGGGVEVETEPGAGSTFSIRIPLAAS